MNKVFYFLVLLSCSLGTVSAQTATLDVSQAKDAKGNDELIFELNFHNEVSRYVNTVEATFSLPPGLADQIVQVMEKSVGDATVMVESRSTPEARILKFKAKNANMGMYKSGDPSSAGKIKIKTNLPFDKHQEVKATVKFDEMPAVEVTSK